jgi:hypothetical protein
MAKLLDTINWVEDGERAAANILNRPLKELITSIDNKDFKVLASTSGFKIEQSDLDIHVESGDLVYKNSDGKYHRALGGNEITENIIGIYTIIDNVSVIVWNGLLIKSELTIGSPYYLSDTAEGEITDTYYDGAIKIGTAISDTELIVGGFSSTGGGVSTQTELSNSVTINANDGDLVYRALDGSINSALVDGTDAENVIGLYKIINSRPSIIYNGEIDGFSSLTVGANYYLSNTTAGDITNTHYNGAIKIGTAISDTQILLDIDNTGATGGGSAPLSLDGITILNGAQDGDFVYKTLDGDIDLALVNGTDKENVIGILQVDAAGRNSIVYGGEVDGFTGLEQGSYYYLSPTVPGKIQVDSYPGAIKVGIANTATTLLVDIDKAPSSSGIEEFEYQFLLSTSSFNQAFFDVFSELNTVTKNDGGTTSNVVYSALNTTYIVQSGSSIETPNNLIEDGSTQYDFFLSTNDDGNFTYQYTIDNGSNWQEIPIDGKFRISAGTTQIKLRFVSTAADAEIKSFGLLFDDNGFESVTNVKLRENFTVAALITSGNPVSIPYGKKYTNDGKSLEVRYEGLTLVPGKDYTELSETTLSFNFDLNEGDIVEFEEFYGYVDVSNENSARIDKEHGTDGSHILTDTVTGIAYKLQISDGIIELVEQ